MQSTLRTKLAAAAMLLVPVGALVAAQPAAADEGDWQGQRYEQRDWRGDRGWYGQRFHRDHRAPEIYAVSPDQGDRIGDRGWTRITARFDDDRSGVDLRTVMLRVDGRDVTRRARIDGDDIRYAEDLHPGRHFAELLVRDRAGNLARRVWTFDVVDRSYGRYGRGYGRTD